MSSTLSLSISLSPVSLFSITNPQKQQKNPSSYQIRTQTELLSNISYTLAKINVRISHKIITRSKKSTIILGDGNIAVTITNHTHAHTDQSHVRVRFCLSVMSVQMSRARVTGENGEKIQHTFLV
uniref:(northern house mosquito) hypothetical protein n=1 Tax=Culex pipiens TaxID=7175 RepID=A0A8D8CRL6_CULPI